MLKLEARLSAPLTSNFRENGIYEAFKRKRLQHTNLAAEADEWGWSIKGCSVEVGCRGFVASSTTRFSTEGHQRICNCCQSLAVAEKKGDRLDRQLIKCSHHAAHTQVWPVCGGSSSAQDVLRYRQKHLMNVGNTTEDASYIQNKSGRVGAQDDSSADNTVTDFGTEMTMNRTTSTGVDRAKAPPGHRPQRCILQITLENGLRQEVPPRQEIVPERA